MSTMESVTHNPEEVPIRDLFLKEDTDFTRWLAKPNNLAQLGEALQFELELIDKEVYCGGFYLDILAKDKNTGCLAVIENQLENSDTGHLGQLITYAAMQEAKILVWIATSFWDKHRAALAWLNRFTLDTIKIYCVEVYGKKVGEMNYYVDFRPVMIPGSSRFSQRFRDFFQPLITDLWWNEITDKKHALYQPHQLFPTGFSDVSYALGFSGSDVWIYLWIATGDSEYNKRVFESLHSIRAKIEESLETTLHWTGQPSGRTQASFGITRKGTIDDSESVLRETRDWMKESVLKFKTTLQPYLESVIRKLQSGDDTPGELLQ